MSKNKEYIKIDVIRYLPLDTYVTFTPEFRFKLFDKAIKQAGNRVKLANIIGTNPTSIWEWKTGRKSKRIPLDKVLKCVKIVNISRNELLANMKNVSSFFKKGTFFIKGWKLLLDEEFAKWLGLLEGDGCISNKYVSCGNTFFELVFFFVKGLRKFFGLSMEQVVVTIWVPSEDKVEDAKLIEYLLEKRGFCRIHIRRRRPGGRARQFLLETRATTKALALLLKSLKKDLPKYLKKSPSSVKASYIAGFASAEGSIVKYKNSRRLSICQKDPNKLIFIKELLNDLGFRNVKGPYPTFHAFGIYISKRRELEKYMREVGFGHHEIKNQKMRNILSSYSQAEHKPKIERVKEILELLKKHESLTGPEVAKEIGITYKYVNKVLNEMIKNGLIKVDNFSRPFI